MNSCSDMLPPSTGSNCSGLSINALRHYDELGLLPPAVVDRAIGYRRYRPEQLRHVKLICSLRRVDMPLPTTSTSAGTGTSVAIGSGDRLPVTGSRTGLMAGLGAAALVLGVVLYLLSRRHRAVPVSGEHTT